MFNPDQNRLAPTLAMIMAASLVGFITGYTVPLISLELAQQQIAPLYVGLLAALPPAGMMISSFLSPALCRRVEMGVLLSGSLILLALAERSAGATPIVIALAALLVGARLLHPLGMSRPAPNAPRFLGAVLTYVAVAALAVLVIARGFPPCASCGAA